LPKAVFGGCAEEKTPSEATSPHPKVDIQKAISGSKQRNRFGSGFTAKEGNV